MGRKRKKKEERGRGKKEGLKRRRVGDTEIEQKRSHEGKHKA